MLQTNPGKVSIRLFYFKKQNVFKKCRDQGMCFRQTILSENFPTTLFPYFSSFLSTSLQLHKKLSFTLPQIYPQNISKQNQFAESRAHDLTFINRIEKCVADALPRTLQVHGPPVVLYALVPEFLLSVVHTILEGLCNYIDDQL